MHDAIMFVVAQAFLFGMNLGLVMCFVASLRRR